jgi:hypothetical protein
MEFVENLSSVGGDILFVVVMLIGCVGLGALAITIFDK